MRQFIVVLVCIFMNTGFSQIASQWRGPDREGIYPQENLLKSWPAEGPTLLWSTKDLGEGYSSAAVTFDRVYITGLQNGTGYLFAFDHQGKQIWKASYGPEWDKGHPGARTTPTVVEDLLYLVSGTGQVACFNTQGKRVWTVDMMQEFGAHQLSWGITESPLVYDNIVICTPGGSKAMIAALDRKTGKTLWATKGNGEKSAYCSPVLVNHNGRRIILTMTGKSVVGVDADTGEFLWQATHRTRYDINPNTPIYDNGFVHTTSGYGTTGSQLFKLSQDGNSIERIWHNEILDSQMGASVLVDGYLYGSGHRNKGWHCLDWKTGETQYSARELGNKGAVIFSDGLLILYSEDGDLALLRPNSQKLDVVRSFKIDRGSGPHWAHPVVKDGRLYVRHGEVMMVYDIAAQ
jgi:outer membrane protein assembly factor BamB